MDKKVKSTAIYGGSFDPPHKGHTAVIKHLIEVFGRVIIVPGFITPFKQDLPPAPAGDRPEMLRIALKEEKIKAKISDFEIKKGGISYTIDTARHFGKSTAGGDAGLYFVLGAENLAGLGLWKDFEQLRKLVSFYVMPRPEYLNDGTGQSVPEALSGLKAEGEAADFTPPDASSALIRAALAFDTIGCAPARKYLTEFMTGGVREYIKVKGLYGRYNAFAGGLKAFKLKPERIEHTFFTVKYAIRLSRIHGADVDKAITAAVLHDIGKEAAGDLSKLDGIKVSVPPDAPPPCRHGYIGADIAAARFGIRDTDILNAVRYHTTCRPAMSDLEKIIALSDYLEESRDFSPDLSGLRAEAERDLDKAVRAMLEAMLSRLKQSGKEIFGLTADALNYYTVNNKKTGDEQ